MKFIEFTTKIYPGKKFREFLDSQEAPDNLSEGDEWKKGLLEAIEPPDPHYVRLYIDPTRILSFTESFSLEESLRNPDAPSYDVVDVSLEDGLEWQLICTMEEFLSKLENFEKQNSPKKAK